MSSREEVFATQGTQRIDVSGRSGDVIVRPSNGDQVVVQLSGDKEQVASTTIETTASSVSVRSKPDRQRRFSKAMDVVVSVPHGSSAHVRVGAGDVTTKVPLDSLDVATGSGDIRIEEEVVDVRVKVASGDVRSLSPVRNANIASANGEIRLGSVRDVVVNTASGDVRVEAVSGTARLKTASGDVAVRRFAGSDLVTSTMSGDITIGLPEGMRIDAQINLKAGEIRNRIKPSRADKTMEASLRVKSFSGDLTLRSAW